MTSAIVYKRINGQYGASYRNIQDTGHHITENNGKFTVWSVHDPDVKIAENVTREEAAKAIAKDWDATP